MLAGGFININANIKFQERKNIKNETLLNFNIFNKIPMHKQQKGVLNHL